MSITENDSMSGKTVRKKAMKAIDNVEQDILHGKISKEMLLKDDELFVVYAFNKTRCNRALDLFQKRKEYLMKEEEKERRSFLKAGNLYYECRFAATRYEKFIYLDENLVDKGDEGVARIIDLIDDEFSLETEFDWTDVKEEEKPKEIGLYQAIIRYIQTAEDDFTLKVECCTPIYTFAK